MGARPRARDTRRGRRGLASFEVGQTYGRRRVLPYHLFPRGRAHNRADDPLFASVDSGVSDCGWRVRRRVDAAPSLAQSGIRRGRTHGCDDRSLRRGVHERVPSAGQPPRSVEVADGERPRKYEDSGGAVAEYAAGGWISHRAELQQ